MCVCVTNSSGAFYFWVRASLCGVSLNGGGLDIQMLGIKSRSNVYIHLLQSAAGGYIHILQLLAAGGRREWSIKPVGKGKVRARE